MANNDNKKKAKIALTLIFFILTLILSGIFLNNLKLNSLEKRAEKLENKIDSVDSNFDKIESAIAKEKKANRKIYKIANEVQYRNYNNVNSDRAYYIAEKIYNEAQKRNISCELLTAIGIVESDLTHLRYRNEKSAIGMFQITPIIEKKYEKNASNFENNVEIAARYISELICRYNGDKKLALAHYNGGSNAEMKMQNYPETKNFVEDVIFYYKNIKKLMEG